MLKVWLGGDDIIWRKIKEVREPALESKDGDLRPWIQKDNGKLQRPEAGPVTAVADAVKSPPES